MLFDASVFAAILVSRLHMCMSGNGVNRGAMQQLAQPVG